MMRYFMIGPLQFKSASNSDLFLANSFVSSEWMCDIYYIKVENLQ